MAPRGIRRAIASRRARRPHRRRIGELLHDAAADHDRVGDARHAPRGRAVADAEAHAHGHLGVRADARDHRLDVARCRCSPRPSRPSATRSRCSPSPRLRHAARCARRWRSARAGRSDRCRSPSSAASQSAALLGRVVDDEHAVDARRLRVRRRTPRGPCARSDWRSPSARPASSSSVLAELGDRTRARRAAPRRASARARRSAGSPGRRPSGRRTARRARSRRRRLRPARASRPRSASGEGSPAVTNGISARGAARRELLEGRGDAAH